MGQYSELREIRDAVLPSDLRQQARECLGADIVNVVGSLLDTVAVEATNYGTKTGSYLSWCSRRLSRSTWSVVAISPASTIR